MKTKAGEINPGQGQTDSWPPTIATRSTRYCAEQVAKHSARLGKGTYAKLRSFRTSTPLTPLWPAQARIKQVLHTQNDVQRAATLGDVFI